MGYFQLQGRLGLFGPVNSSSRATSKNQSSLVLGIIVFVHGLIILLALNEKAEHRELVPEKILHMINLLPESKESIPNPDKPEVLEPRVLNLNAPLIQFSESISSPLNIPLNDSPYELPTQQSGQYGNVFDPKMKQKLIDAQGINRPAAQEKSRTWTAIDGRTFIEMGDGVCMVSMAKVDSRDRGNSWGYTSCGKNDSEKAMDRVMADFESRKAPLGKLKPNP